MEFDVLIPARYGASRLPGKLLLEVHGKPLLQWTYEGARKSSADNVIVATDDERIKQAVEKFGGSVCMTRSDHRSGSDRIAEAAELLELAADRCVVNVQGDEPGMPGSLIDQVATRLVEDEDLSVVTACHQFDQNEEIGDPNIVKVVRDKRGHALYFSRAPIPWPRTPETNQSCALRHIGIYAYRVDFLRRFTSWPATELEKVEQLEQLRILENGVPMALCEAVEHPGPGIDTAQDLERFKNLVAHG